MLIENLESFGKFNDLLAVLIKDLSSSINYLYNYEKFCFALMMSKKILHQMRFLPFPFYF